MKQIALTIFMAQIGSFIAAQEGSTLGIVDKIFLRMQTSDYNSFESSTFFTDVSQVTHALENLTPQSLLLIDEFGKGTDVNVGIAMFAGLVQYLQNLGCKHCPRTFLVTHFNEVITHRLIAPESALISWKKMQFVVDDSDGAKQELVFLYKLLDGQCLESWGIHCARMASIPEDIIERATYISKLYSPFTPVSFFLPNPSKDSSVAFQNKLHQFFSACQETNIDLRKIKSIFQ
jgi:DNA mismatch repair protein MSH5